MSARSFPWPTVKEDDEEDDDNKEPNENKAPADNVIHEADEHHPTTSIKIMTASEKLSNACFGMVIRNSCKQVNCEYSHDKAIIAVARDKQIVDLMVAKRAMQDSHQATMKVFDKAGAKVFKPTAAQLWNDDLLLPMYPHASHRFNKFWVPNSTKRSVAKQSVSAR
jgi:hypothetical protein